MERPSSSTPPRFAFSGSSATMRTTYRRYSERVSPSSSARSHTARKSASLTRAVRTLSYFKTFVIVSSFASFAASMRGSFGGVSVLEGRGASPAWRRPARSRAEMRSAAPPLPLRLRRRGGAEGRRKASLPPSISCIRDRLLAGNGAGAPSGRLHGAKFVRGACRPFPRYPRAPACPARSVRPVLSIRSA